MRIIIQLKVCCSERLKSRIQNHILEYSEWNKSLGLCGFCLHTGLHQWALCRSENICKYLSLLVVTAEGVGKCHLVGRDQQMRRTTLATKNSSAPDIKAAGAEEPQLKRKKAAPNALRWCSGYRKNHWLLSASGDANFWCEERVLQVKWGFKYNPCLYF